LVKVIHVPVQSNALVREIDGSLESLADLVQGEPQSTELDDDLVLWYPEYAPRWSANFTFEGRTLCGAACIARYKAGEQIDVTTDDIDEYFSVFERLPMDALFFSPYEA